MKSTSIILPPFSFIVDGVQVDVLEVLSSRLVDGSTVYSAVLQVTYKGIKSRRFTIPVKSASELISKARAEVYKMKWIEYAYGINELKRLIT